MRTTEQIAATVDWPARSSCRGLNCAVAVRAGVIRPGGRRTRPIPGPPWHARRLAGVRGSLRQRVINPGARDRHADGAGPRRRGQSPPLLIGRAQDKRIPATLPARLARHSGGRCWPASSTIGGTVTSNGAIQPGRDEPRLAWDVRELVLSLGYRCSMPNGGTAHEATAPRYLVRFVTDDQVFLLSRKQRLHKERLRQDPRMARWRYIVGRAPGAVAAGALRAGGQRRTTCTWRADGMIPTHNSTLALDLARAASIKARPDRGDVQPGDEPQRDHHAAALGRGAGAAALRCGPARWARTTGPGWPGG